MVNEKEIEVLSGLRILLKLSNLYNKNGVYFKYNKNGDSVKIPDFFLFCLILLPTLYTASLFLWFVIDEKFNLTITSNSLVLAIANIQMAISFISMAMKSDLVRTTVDHLQEAVERSKWSRTLEKNLD